MYYHWVAVDPEDWARQFFRAAGEIDGVNTVVRGIVGLGNPLRRGPPGFIATPCPLGSGLSIDVQATLEL
jgi:hypothetical protein